MSLYTGSCPFKPCVSLHTYSWTMLPADNLKVFKRCLLWSNEVSDGNVWCLSPRESPLKGNTTTFPVFHIPGYVCPFIYQHCYSKAARGENILVFIFSTRFVSLINCPLKTSNHFNVDLGEIHIFVLRCCLRNIIEHYWTIENDQTFLSHNYINCWK